MWNIVFWAFLVGMVVFFYIYTELKQNLSFIICRNSQSCFFSTYYSLRHLCLYLTLNFLKKEAMFIIINIIVTIVFLLSFLTHI